MRCGMHPYTTAQWPPCKRTRAWCAPRGARAALSSSWMSLAMSGYGTNWSSTWPARGPWCLLWMRQTSHPTRWEGDWGGGHQREDRCQRDVEMPAAERSAYPGFLCGCDAEAGPLFRVGLFAWLLCGDRGLLGAALLAYQAPQVWFAWRGGCQVLRGWPGRALARRCLLCVLLWRLGNGAALARPWRAPAVTDPLQLDARCGCVSWVPGSAARAIFICGMLLIKEAWACACACICISAFRSASCLWISCVRLVISCISARSCALQAHVCTAS